ncbi:MAG TPA: Uma2 family endonuclease [Caulobacteraceae bacterium]|nr:Uma2 family endonuclease [Caulobacteraceae bacterium]
MGADPVFLTRAAEGLDRRGFTVEEVEAMISAGVIHADEKFELIEGEIVPVNPQAMPHLTMKARLARALLATCPAHIDIAQDATVMLGRRSFFDADILAFQADPTRRYVAPADALLAVEIADSSRARDLFTKAPRYGAAGLAELWVVELNEQQTYVFRSPGTAAWSEPARVGFDEPISPLFLPDAAIRLGPMT